jgi:DME family drug/metabolite transporter
MELFPRTPDGRCARRRIPSCSSQFAPSLDNPVEWPSLRRVTLVAITLAGVWLSVLGAEEVPALHGSTGMAWGVLAAIGYAAYTVFGRYASPRFGSGRTVFYSTLGSCVILLAMIPAIEGPPTLPQTPGAWWLLLAFGFLTIAAAHTLFFDALGRIEAGRVSIAAAIEPAVAGLLATTILGQGLSPVGWAGIGLIVIGVAGVGLTRDRAAAE